MRSRLFHFCLLLGMCFPAASAQDNKQVPSPTNHSGQESSTRQPPGKRTPQPSPEMQKLVNALSGTWSLREEYEHIDSMPGGGLGKGDVVWRPGPGGLSLIEDYHSKNPKGHVFGLSVTWWDEIAKGYWALWCADSLPTGCTVMARLAKWEGNQLVLGDEFASGGKKFTFKETVSDITPKTYTQTLYQG